MRLTNWLIIAVLVLGAGCAHYASDEESKIQPGMTPDQVIAKLGEPEHVKRVRFPGHQRDYLVLEYNLVPEIPACPSSAAARAITGMLTLGVSEVGWTNAQATPHWIYFLDNKMVFFSEAVDCKKEGCRTWIDIRDKNYASTKPVPKSPQPNKGTPLKND
jgi:hypothetical protein